MVEAGDSDDFGSLEEIYADIADSLDGLLPENWEIVWVRAEFEADFSSLQGLAQLKGGPQVDVELSDEVEEAFGRLYLALSANDQRWKVALFTLKDDDTFKIDLDYEDENRWRKDFLPPSMR